MAGPADVEYPNVWPAETELPGFRSWMEQYWAKSHEVTLQVLSALELALELPQDSLVSRCNGCKGEIRMNHYPATPTERLRDENVRRIWPHTDASVITLLVQDGNGGLEIEDQASPGTFEPLLLVDRSELIVNGGETLERWTNGRLLPGLHQVTVPRHFKDLTSQIVPSRHSVAYFQNANPEVSVAPLESFLSNGKTSEYKDMTSAEYLRLRNAVIY